MSELFDILEVTSIMRISTEPLGSKPKFWFRHNGKKWLFKEAREKTGEDWAEKIGSEVASLLGLPTHHTELASWEGRRGCAVESFLPSDGSVLVHGNELLGGVIHGYDMNLQRGQSDHTLDNIVTVVNGLFPEARRRDAALRMAGYLVFDALIGNTDRHHQNWGVLLEFQDRQKKPSSFTLQLAPTFDHASSLGRELADGIRERHLRENTVERYLKKGKGGIFHQAQPKHGLSPLAAAQMLAAQYPDFFKPWQKRVSLLSDQDLSKIVDRVPDSRISVIGREFVLAVLFTNRKLIKEIL